MFTIDYVKYTSEENLFYNLEVYELSAKTNFDSWGFQGLNVHHIVF